MLLNQCVGPCIFFSHLKNFIIISLIGLSSHDQQECVLEIFGSASSLVDPSSSLFGFETSTLSATVKRELIKNSDNSSDINYKVRTWFFQMKIP